MKYLLFFLCSLFLLASCSSSEEEQQPPQPAKRTVIVYMSAENDLSTFASTNINDMVKGRKQIAENENLIIFVDRASSMEKPFLAMITKDDAHPVDTLYKYTEDFVASDPKLFTEVLKTAVACCPAQEYGLVLWGHSNGWAVEKDSIATNRAYGRDTGNNTTDGKKGQWLNIPSLRQALEQTGIHWKFIFCDCCNMQCIEVAYELRKRTEYFIASPAEITGVGAPYSTLVKDFYIEDDKQMAQQICVDYHAQVDYVSGHLPISAIKTEQLDALAEETRNILPEVDHYLKTVENPTKGIINYYAYNKRSDNEKVMYDMKDMIRAALENEPEKYEIWLKSFSDAVVHAEISNLWHANTVDFSDFTVSPEKYGGVSMFFPLDKYKTTVSHKYNEDIKQMAWYYAVGWPRLEW